MYCEKYRCRMSKEACFARRRNALMTAPKFQYKPGFGDVVCKVCEQGAAIMEEIDPDAAAKYSADLKSIRTKALKNMGKDTPKATPKDTAMETKVCADQNCKKAGKEQPLDAFQRRPQTGNVGRYCKACLARRMRAGRKKKKVDPAVSAGVSKVVEHVQSKRPAADNPGVPLVSFADHPDLLKRIAETATMEYRTPADQLLWMVKSYVSPAEATS